MSTRVLQDVARKSFQRSAISYRPKTLIVRSLNASRVHLDMLTGDLSEARWEPFWVPMPGSTSEGLGVRHRSGLAGHGRN